MAYTLIAREGNLLSEPDATFIVNASNTRLLLGSGVSMAFKRHCGIGLEAEMQQALARIEGGLTPGDVVATSSGEANNFRYALHAAIMNYNRGARSKKPTLQTIRTALEQIEGYLHWYAQDHNRRIKLVLPLLGCGTGGLDKHDVLGLYRGFFRRPVPFDCDVVVYGFGREDYEAVRGIIA